MSSSKFDHISDKIDAHLEKTGVVLVGMHQELQEQKRRIGLYQGKVDMVTSDLARRSDEIVATLGARAEIAVSVLDDVEPLVSRIREIAGQADNAIQSAGERLANAQESLVDERKRFKSDSEQLIASVNEKMSASSKEATEFIRQAEQRLESATDGVKSENSRAFSAVASSFSASLAQANADGNAALSSMVEKQRTALNDAQKVFSEAVFLLDSRFKAHVDAHQKFLISAHEELTSRQRASDEAFVALKNEIARHQSREVEFAKKTRLISIALTVFGAGALAFLVYVRGLGV